MSAKAYYHLPGLFEFYEFYRAFLPLYRANRDWFYDWCEDWVHLRRTGGLPLGRADERVSVSAAHAERWLLAQGAAFPRG